MSADVEAAGPAAGALLAAVGTTFGTYMLADFLLNFLQHPSQKINDHSMGNGRASRHSLQSAIVSNLSY